jgi:hypothetical protein
MSLETYWLMVAPGLLFGLSAIGWAWLFLTRHHDDGQKATGAGNVRRAWLTSD